MAEPQDAPNSLGLDFQQTPTSPPESKATTEGPTEGGVAEDAGKQQAKKERVQPYVNHERVKTGGAQRDKLSDEALAEKMARIREQNEKIKQRRADVQADEAAFKKTQEAEQQQRARIKKVQENVDRSREANAARKMAKVQNREWDADKRGGPKGRGGGPQRDAPGSPAAEGAPATPAEETSGSPENAASEASGADSDRWARGRGAPGGRARGSRGGRGRGGRGGRGGANGPASPSSEVAPTPAAES